MELSGRVAVVTGAASGIGLALSERPELVDTRVFESTRNAHSWTGLRPPRPVAIQDVEQLMGSTAMAPAAVADAVVAAVRDGRFWIITHETTRRRLRSRNADLEAERNPSLGPAS